MSRCTDWRQAGCPRHGGPGILPGVNRAHAVSLITRICRHVSGCPIPFNQAIRASSRHLPPSIDIKGLGPQVNRREQRWLIFMKFPCVFGE